MKIDKDAELIAEAYKKTLVKEEFEEQIRPLSTEGPEQLGPDPDEVAELEKLSKDTAYDLVDKLEAKYKTEEFSFSSLIGALRGYVGAKGIEGSVEELLNALSK
jgi:hypothetical protein